MKITDDIFISKPAPGAVVNDLTDKELVLNVVNFDKKSSLTHNLNIDLSLPGKVKGKIGSRNAENVICFATNYSQAYLFQMNLRWTNGS